MNEATPASVMPAGAVVSAKPFACRRLEPDATHHHHNGGPLCSMNYADVVKSPAPIPRLSTVGGSFWKL